MYYFNYFLNYILFNGVNESMDSPSNDLAKKTGRLTGIKINKNDMSPAQATIMQLILQVQETFLDRTNQQDAKLEEIVAAQRHTNGDVTEVRAQVEILKEKEAKRTAAIVEHTIAKQAVELATRGVWMMPKPNWKTWSILGAIITFLGFERIVSVLSYLLHIFSVLAHS